MNPSIPLFKDKPFRDEPFKDEPFKYSASSGVSPALVPAGHDAEAMRLPAAARILIIRFSSLGDVVKATALPRLVKAAYPDAHVTMITAEHHLPLIAGNPHLERAIGFRRREGLYGLWRLGRQLRREGWDLIADVHKSLRSRLLSSWIGAPRAAYTKRTGQRFLLVRFGINTYRSPRRKEEDFLAALAPYGVRDDGLGTEISLEPLRRDDTFAGRFAEPLARIRAWHDTGLPVLGVAPVAAWDLKRWPSARFAELMAAFVRETGGGVVIFGGKEDRQAEALAAPLGASAVSLVGRTSLLESAHFATLTDSLVSNDTGMAHLAEAVGVDVIVIFGPTTRELGYFPARDTSRVIEYNLPCRPCTRMGEGRCTHPLRKACLRLIQPDTVLAAILAVLPGRSGVSSPGLSGEASC